MDQQQTIELWERCEAARAKARAEAQAAGKAKDDAETLAHEAAKAEWNGWAEQMLAKRKALEEAGEWAAEKNWTGDLVAKNEVTRVWMAEASVDFSNARFLCEAFAHQQKPRVGEGQEESQHADDPL
ncbi:MAG: hypothetical protein P8Y67_07370, partial [Alphaproteobacteria bacterium]